MRKNIVFSLVALTVGILISLQMRSFQKIEMLIQRAGPAEALAQIQVFQLANTELRAQIDEENKNLDEMRKKIASVTIEDEINRLKLFAGEEAVQGEGIEITINKPVEEFWISDLVAQLVSASAEAVAVNDVRITSRTAGFKNIGGGLMMRRNFFRPPFRLTVIGSKQELKQILSQNGGIIDRIQNSHPGLTVFLEQKDNIIIPAVTD